MSKSVNRARRARLVAALAVVAVPFAAAPAAYATDEFPSYPWATITHSCDDQQSVGGIYAITIGNGAGAQSSATIHVEVSGKPASDHTLLPGASTVLKGNPGEDQQLDVVVSSGGDVLAELSKVADCVSTVVNGSVEFACGEHHPYVDYVADPEGNVGPVVFDLVLPDGSTTQWSVDGVMKGGFNVVEDSAYDVSISSGGVLLDSASGVADCFVDDEPDEPRDEPQDEPETTTTTAVDDPEPETVVPVTVEQADVTTTTTTVAPATAVATLPVTGRSSAPVALAGGGALALGVALLAALRRRTAGEV